MCENIYFNPIHFLPLITVNPKKCTEYTGSHGLSQKILCAIGKNNFTVRNKFAIRKQLNIKNVFLLGDPTEAESQQISEIWQNSLFNAHYQAQRSVLYF